MSSAPAERVLAHLATLLDVSAGQPLSDRQLLDRFVRAGDQAAFGVLVQRHGPLVLGVCRRVLGHAEDAEDAFQATFLVLARRAGHLAWQESIGSWLHEVAFRTARKARAGLGRHRAHERRAASMPRPEPTPPDDLADVGELLDEEVRALPEKFRGPVVLCCLEGLSRDEAAARLGLTGGAVKDRLERGREMLRQRLARRGVTTASAVTASVPAVPATLTQKAIAAGVAYAAGTTAVSAGVADLAEGVLTTMTMTKGKGLALLATLLVLGVTVGLGAYASRPAPETPTAETPTEPVLAARPDDNDDPKKDERPTVEGKVLAVDAANEKLTVLNDDGGDEVTLAVPPDAKVVVGRQAMKLADVRKDMLAKVVLKSETDRAAAEVHAGWRPFRSDIKAVDLAGGKLTVSIEAQEDLAFDVALPVVAGAAVKVDDLAASLSDLAGRKNVSLELSADKKSITKVDAEADDDELGVVILGADPVKGEVTVELENDAPRGARKPALSLPLAKDVKVRIGGKDGLVLHLVQDMPALLKLGKDRRTVERVLADQPRAKRIDD